ncbi:MAG: hypothetical protein U9Q90_08450 [Campylobacterota bacterium]|nr:hypothetical protein [Campylobacterota bacterium]
MSLRLYGQSEEGLFHQLLKINKGGTVIKIYEAFYLWIPVATNRTDLFSFEDIVTKEPILNKSVNQLQKGIENPKNFDRHAFEKDIKLQRAHITKKISKEKYGLIESMN